MNYGDGTQAQNLRLFQSDRYLEDATFVEAQRPLRLPLLGQAQGQSQFPQEVHKSTQVAIVVLLLIDVGYKNLE